MSFYRPREKIALAAHKFDGTNFDFLFKWGSPDRGNANAKIVLEGYGDDPNLLTVYSPQGPRDCRVGDWIVQGITGEFFPMTQAEFELTYEPIEGT